MTADWETSSTLQGKANRLKGKGVERGREEGGERTGTEKQRKWCCKSQEGDSAGQS